MFRGARWGECMPFSCGIADPRHDLLDRRSSTDVTVPALLDELPQGFGDPDGFRVLRFIWANAKRDLVREFQGFDISERLLSSQDLTDRSEKKL